MRRKAGITRRTFLFVALLIVLVTFVSFAILYFAMPSYYLYKKEQALKQGLEKLEDGLKSSTELEACADLIVDFSETYNVTVTTIAPSGIPIIQLSTPFLSMKSQHTEHSQIIINGETAEEEQLKDVITELYQIIVTGDEKRVRIKQGKEEISTYITYEVGTDLLMEADIGTILIGKIQIQGTLQPIEEARGVILSLIPYALAAGSGIGLCLAWIYAQQITKPIRKLSAVAVKMKQMEHNVTWTSGVRTNDELGLLSENMDALYMSLSETIESLKAEMDKVNRLEQSKTEMMQAASHELKTPIAALSGMLDGMIDNVGVYKDKEKYLAKCKEQVEKLSFLVKEILAASKTDNDGQMNKLVDTEVDDMIRHILTEYEFIIKEKQLLIDTQMDSVTIQTESVLLYRALANLIGNAVMYTPKNGVIHIALTANQLDIENECSHIPEEELQKLFEPFYTRSGSRDKTVSGTGLGLYIVKRNLERLSISYHIQNTDTGFKITLHWQAAIRPMES